MVSFLLDMAMHGRPVDTIYTDFAEAFVVPFFNGLQLADDLKIFHNIDNVNDWTDSTQN